MEKNLFRQETLDHISSPEELHDYMKVTSPRLWMVLVAVVAILVGFIIYASIATLENTLTVKAEICVYTDTDTGVKSVDDFMITIPEDKKDLVQRDMVVRFSGSEGKIDYIFQDKDSTGAHVYFEQPIDPANLETGEYDAVIVLEQVSPIKFLIN